ncbi:unnamed protein product [Ambrosiozyma monospora]|uniref:Unnamed protein product n=1 Tax=Ambrosiozyma monospora TaxID=43982 RepID=A0A9W6YQY4_AMBMO|nr:unnamed protein product [Ambrosiozyma monospora]
MRSIVQKVENDELDVDEISEQAMENNFYYNGEAEKVDILVRTSGHTRLSDYMLWQCHQESVIECSNILWPEYKFCQAWWTIFKWSYFKTLIVQDAETMELKKVEKESIKERYTNPAF